MFYYLSWAHRAEPGGEEVGSTNKLGPVIRSEEEERSQNKRKEHVSFEHHERR